MRPGSTLVANDRAMCCSYDAVKDLPGYQSVISVETLIKLDLPGTRRIQENLGKKIYIFMVCLRVLLILLIYNEVFIVLDY